MEKIQGKNHHANNPLLMETFIRDKTIIGPS